MPEEEICWHFRFRNFSRALRRLQDALQEGAEALNELEQEGVIQRFEYTFELPGTRSRTAWSMTVWC